MLPILSCFPISGCVCPPGPLGLPEQPFLSDGCSCFPDLDSGDCYADRDRLHWWGGTPDERRIADAALALGLGPSLA